MAVFLALLAGRRVMVFLLVLSACALVVIAILLCAFKDRKTRFTSPKGFRPYSPTPLAKAAATTEEEDEEEDKKKKTKTTSLEFAIRSLFYRTPAAVA